MIVEALVNLILAPILLLINLLPQLPEIPALESVHEVLNVIFSNLQLLGVFIRPSTIKFIVPLWLAVDLFVYRWHLLMFVVKKIPLLGIK